MIELTAENSVGAEPTVLIDIDRIILLQRQTPATGKVFTAVFLQGAPPFAVKEEPHEIAQRIMDARKRRAQMTTWFGFDKGRPTNES